MRVICKTQRTQEWFSLRAGRVTASRIGDAMAKLTKASKNGSRGDWKQSHWDYVSELAWERITGIPAEHYVTKPMDIGQQYEGESKVEYWQRYGVETDDVGLVLHPSLDYLAASPDSLVGPDGLAEFKVPTFKVHCSYLESGEIPEEYKLQMQCQMLCCERPWNDFVSYCPPDVAPELPDEFRMFRKRLVADPTVFTAIEDAATATMEHVAERMATLRSMYPGKDAPKSKFRQQLESAALADELSESEAYEAAAGYIDGLEVTP